MFEAITSLFTKSEAPLSGHEPKVAVAALLVHLAAVDGQMSEAERAVIKTTLMEQYGLDESSVERLIKEAAARDAEAVDFYNFTSTLSGMEMDERINIIRMMWTVVFADKENHEMEDNMVWRVAELIGVSSRDRTILRKQIGSAVSDPI
ncbi:TerB family tellurite resistance protein [Devosia sp. FKR38]|uniref:tellurite resistance TerB family protein n=1 Tax=Devosia sp. FKR38 TaxID=2562312 RepID=UPI0014853751|nr:TerB family tellurite resistance protein [Devosia sp. FKR38]